MKKLLPFLILSATTTLTFAQGIVNFFNDSLHAVYFTADTTNLLSADTGLALNAMPANGTALPSGSILYADLWAGSASDNMTLQATSSQWSISKGRWSAKMVTLSNLPSNQLGYFQVVISTNIVGPGTVVLSPTNPVPFRTIVTASAIAAPGNYFKLWSGAASGTNSPTTFAVTTPTPTLSALFTAVPEGKCTLNVVVNTPGRSPR